MLFIYYIDRWYPQYAYKYTVYRIWPMKVWWVTILKQVERRTELLLLRIFAKIHFSAITRMYLEFTQEFTIHSVSFISNAVNFQPVSNLRFSIVVACVCCLVSKKNSCLLLIFQENNGFSKKKQNFWPLYLVKK